VPALIVQVFVTVVETAMFAVSVPAKAFGAETKASERTAATVADSTCVYFTELTPPRRDLL
jgi:hypothetical protein